MDRKTEIDHLASAIILTGKAEGAAMREDVSAAEELDCETDFELDLMEDGK